MAEVTQQLNLILGLQTESTLLNQDILFYYKMHLIKRNLELRQCWIKRESPTKETTLIIPWFADWKLVEAQALVSEEKWGLFILQGYFPLHSDFLSQFAWSWFRGRKYLSQ